jgi:hypothetical protein
MVHVHVSPSVRLRLLVVNIICNESSSFVRWWWSRIPLLNLISGTSPELVDESSQSQSISKRSRVVMTLINPLIKLCVNFLFRRVD